MIVMKKLSIIVLFVQVAFTAFAQYQTVPNAKGDKYFVNPILAGDNPDPSILRNGDDYYIVTSSFEYYPGLPIWHSTDLINWTPVTNALNKYVSSVWAPDLVKVNNKYYIYFPANNTNYVITADNIAGPWSDPVEIKLDFIDPGHVTDADGKRYLYFNSGGYVPLTDDGMTVAGTFQHTYNGWQIPREWSIECFCMEGPKLVKRGEYYYLTVAEGGTAGPATSHMIISARSKSPLGPWENSPFNPIERTKDNTERWWSKGHGTLFEDAKGSWWMLFHAYEKDHYNMGRQTLLEPVEWTKDGWFKIAEGIKTDEPIRKPALPATKPTFSLSDNFGGESLKLNWKFYGEYDTARFQLVDNSLVMKAKGNSVANCSPMLCVPTDHSYTADVEIITDCDAIGGLVLFYNPSFNSGILADSENVLANLRGWQFATEKKVHKNHVFLRLKNINNTIDMYYSLDGINWNKTENSLDVSGMHHNVLSGFMSLRLGLCAIGNGTVTFRNFVYKSIQ